MIMKLSDIKIGDKITFAKPMMDGSVVNWVVADCDLHYSTDIEITSLAGNWNDDLTDASNSGFDIVKVERYQTLFERGGE